MKILLTNDDGYFADGLQSLAKQLRRQHEVQIVAPEEECSNCSHQVTAREALLCRQIDANTWAVNGWPADCIRIALKHLQVEVDCVIAGVNHGGNLGVDIAMSGTCAAAREAAIHCLPAFAVSQVRKSGIDVDWGCSAARAVSVLDALLGEQLPVAGFWNINLPAVGPADSLAEVKECKPDPSPLLVRYLANEHHGLQFQSDYHSRPRITGRDVDLCFRGHPTLSFVGLTH